MIAGGGPFTLTAGQSRQVVVAFAPSAVGPSTAVLDLGVDACVDVPCQGVGREYGPYCVVVPEAVDGGEVPVTVPVTFPVTVYNQGETPLSVNAQIDAPGFSIVAGGGPRQVAPGGQLEVRVRFVSPVPGVYTASLDLGTDSCTDVPITVTVREAIVSCAWDSANPARRGRPRRRDRSPSSTSRSANTGEIALPDVTFALTGEGFHIVTGGGPVTIPASGVHTVRVAFIPTELGSFTAQLAPSIACCEPLTLLGDGQRVAAVVLGQPDPGHLRTHLRG